MSELAVIVLAAGQGTRMKSRKAKVLHEVCGRQLLGHVLETAESLEPERLTVVVGRDAAEVQRAFAGRAEFVLQAEQRGTGHAVAQAIPKLRDFRGEVLVLYADVPLLRRESLVRLRKLRASTGADLVMLTSPEPLPGLIVRDAKGRVERVVERTDATPDELQIQEGNTGVYLLDAELLRQGLASLDDRNEQGELYLTDIVGFAVSRGCRVEAIQLADASECLGVNTRAELAEAGAELRWRKLDALMAGGVSIVDPDHTYIDVQVRVGRDTLIEPGCVIQGDTAIGEGVHVRAHCTIEDSRIDDDVVIGPCAHLRAGTHLMSGVRIGNFVEVKNSVLGRGVKADHLSYVGDSDVGEGSSFGCGAITVNYDWKGKHRTTIGKHTRVGCNVNLIAPVELGDHVAVAAGSTITGPVPDDALSVARARQRNIDGWTARREGRAAPRSASSAAKPTPEGAPAEARTRRASATPDRKAARHGKVAPPAKGPTARKAEPAKRAAAKTAAKKKTASKAAKARKAGTGKRTVAKKPASDRASARARKRR